MWHHRNEIAHECMEEKLNQKESDQLKERIVIEYEKGSRGVLLVHKHMFSEKSANLLEKAVIEKKYWLMQIEASRACVKKLSSPDHDMQGILKKIRNSTSLVNNLILQRFQLQVVLHLH